MFKKLKTKFILINMSLLTLVFVTIFGSIYFIMNTSLNREINITLEDLIRDDKKQKPISGNISVNLDENNNIINYFVHLNTDITSNNLQNYIDNVLESNTDSGEIKIDNSLFVYKKEDFGYSKKIVFLDISYQESLKLKLLQVFILAGGGSLILLLIISIYLTNKSIEPIKDTFEKQKQFIADASHELKTPLTIIKTNTSLVLSNPEDSVREQSKWIHYIDDQSDRMSELINEMLTMAKLDTSENKLILTPINMSKIIQSMLLGFDAVIFENNILLEENIAKNIFINGNEESIKKLFSIIIDNAIKYTNKNGKISVSLFLDRNKARLEVINTGEGIPSKDLERIFERFYRVDNSRARESGGYGLGLSIAKSIVSQHKGKIYAKSTLNKSTSFIIELPYIQNTQNKLSAT